MLKKIGYIGVDSGQILIVDPCYLSKWKDGDFKAESKDDKPDNSYDESGIITCFNGNSFGQHSIGGFVSSTLWGDGTYPIYAELDDRGIPKRLIIDFE